MVPPDTDHARAEAPKGAARFLGSLRDALAAAGREEPPRSAEPQRAAPPPLPQAAAAPAPVAMKSPEPAPAPAASEPARPSAQDAAREARGGAPHVRPVSRQERAIEPEAPPTTRVVRGEAPKSAAKTELIRGKRAIARKEFHQDPVVGWLVIIGGPGLGSFRTIYEGNNTIGRAASQRIPLDFGDDTISAEEQAYLRYDGADRTFLLVPNLSKTNVVAVNDKKPTQAAELKAMDVITIGRTQLVFVPFCGTDFDWSDLSGLKA